MSVTKHQIELTWLRFCQWQLALILLNDVSNLAEVIFFFKIKKIKKKQEINLNLELVLGLKTFKFCGVNQIKGLKKK